MRENDVSVKQAEEKYQSIDLAGRQVKIRRFRFDESDYEAIVAIANAIEPETPSSTSAWRHRDRNRDKKYFFERYIAKYEGRIVATVAIAHSDWSYHPDKYFVDIKVHPDSEGKGITSVIYDYVLDVLAARQPRKLVSSTREHRKNRIRFLEQRGYRQVMKAPISRLDSASVNVRRFADKVKRVLDSGIAIKTMRQLSEEDPNWKRKLYELEWECFQDVPSIDPPTKRSYQEFENGALTSPNLLPDAYFVAVDGDQYVGQSMLWRNLATDHLLETGLTGVVRSHRRRGIATAMKIRAIEYAQAHGNAAILTDNEENNPMFQINLQLGFVPQPAFLVFEKYLED